MSACVTDSARALACRDGAAATSLRLLSLGVIFLASAAGVASPVAFARALAASAGGPSITTSAYERALLLVKCFAAGVVLSTALVHVLPDAQAALTDCHLAALWRNFPFSGLLCLIGALLALLVDLAASSSSQSPDYSPIDTQLKAAADGHHSSTTISTNKDADLEMEDVALVELGAAKSDAGELSWNGAATIMAATVAAGCHAHGHWPTVDVQDGSGAGEEEKAVRAKQRMVSKLLEIGIIFHSVIIGATLGMSQDVCAIRPLVIALTFHQIFEGMGLGGCIAQAGFGAMTVFYMCMMFAVTTPMGIILGMVIFRITGYGDSSPNALIAEGLLGSLSAGILVYMALVDLIALDFFHNKTMSRVRGLKKASYLVLVLGSASMSILALWA